MLAVDWLIVVWLIGDEREEEEGLIVLEN